MPSEIISGEITPLPGHGHQAAMALQRLGFRILHIGQTVSVQAAKPVWEAIFQLRFEIAQSRVVSGLEEIQSSHYRPVEGTLVIPDDLRGLLSDVAIAGPPEFY